MLPEGDKKRRNRSCEMSDSEIITILLLFHFGTFKNFKHYYLHYIDVHLKKDFTKQLPYNRFIEIEHYVFVPMMFFLNTICFDKCTWITFIDSTSIRVCNSKRIKRNRVFDGIAQIGKSTMGWFHGFKLHLVCNDKGELFSFCLIQGNVDDRDPKTLKTLTKKQYDVHLVTGIRSNMKNRLMSFHDRIMLRKCSVNFV